MRIMDQTVPPLSEEENCFLCRLDSHGRSCVEAAVLSLGAPGGKGISRPRHAALSGGRAGYFKNTDQIDRSDDLEIVINYLGRLLGVEMAEEYRVFGPDGAPIGLFSRDAAANGGRFVEARSLVQSLRERLRPEQLAHEAWIAQWIALSRRPAFPDLPDNYEYRGETPQDCLSALLLPLRVLKALGYAPEERFLQAYLRMICFDLCIGQTDRTLDNFGILAYDDGSCALAPLFDNATLEKPYLPSNLYSLCGVVLDRALVAETVEAAYPAAVRMIRAGMLQALREHEAQIASAAAAWVGSEHLLLRNLRRWIQTEEEKAV